MKLSRVTRVGIFVFVIGLISFGIFMLIPRSFTYSKMKVDISVLRALKGNFKSLYFKSVSLPVSGVNKMILTPVITVVSGNPGNYSGVIKAEKNDTILNFLATPYPSKYDVSLVQIDSLLAIPEVAYFIVVANKYPPNLNMVAYTIRPYNVSGGLIVMNKAYLKLNPCPPAIAYQSSTPN